MTQTYPLKTDNLGGKERRGRRGGEGGVLFSFENALVDH
jgi:hypothetical protein